jgi:hypothetical protein
MIRNQYRQLPDIPTNYVLDDVWSIVVPIARTNLIANPSFETNTTSWTAVGGSIARSTTQQYHGAYSLAITPTATTTDGARYDTVSLSSGTTYAYSTKLRGVAGLKYKLSIETTGGVELSSVTVTATGRWQWVVGYYTETSSTTRRVYARKAGHASTAIFYIDGVQVEAIASGETVSTYIDGDQLGLVPNQLPVAYYWNGTAHASTSTRSAQTRAGGMVISFKKYGFLLTAMIGLGLAAPVNVGTEYARIDGGYDDYTRKPPRQFTLTGRFQGRTYAELRRNRSGLAQYFDRDLTGQDQRLILLRSVENRNGDAVSSTTRHLVKYESGFGGATDNSHAETVPLTFTQYLPNIIADGESGASLNVQTSIASNTNGILQRSSAGVWSSMGSVTGGFGVYSIVRGLDGLIYIGGDFTPAPAASVASWNPLTSTFSAMGTGAAGGLVYQLAVMPDGSIIAVGTFTSMGGVANTNKVAKWSPSGGAWSSISSAWVGTELRCAAVGANGILYVGGSGFTISGTAVNNIAQYNGSAWSAVGAGIAAGGVTSIVAVGTTLYAAVEASGVYKYNGSSWTNIGATSGGDATSLAVDAAGSIYAAGAFTSIGGVSANRIAKYNGVAWFPLGTGLNGSVNTRAMSFDSRGLLYVGGDFTTAGGITTPTGSAIWNGAAWVYSDIIPAATAHMYGALALPNGQLYQGTINGGTAIGPGTATITNTGTARAYPTLTITGPSSSTARIYSLVNATTGRSIYLNLTINAGETVKMVFQPDNLSFTSDFQGNIAGAILGGSNEADFFLQPGANSIAFLSGSSTVTATLSWRPSYASIDDVP